MFLQIKRNIFLLVLVAMVPEVSAAGTESMGRVDEEVSDTVLYNERYRPQFHFTPAHR